MRNVNSLRAFHAVVITRSMTQAGERLGLTQSAVSRLVAGLEAELGFPLFYRQAGRLMITPQGETFYVEAEQVLAGLDNLDRVGKSILSGHGPQLRVFSMSPFVGDLLPISFLVFHEKFPTVQASLDIRGGREFIYWDVGRRFDLGLAVLPGDKVAANTRVFARVQALAVLPRTHKLAGAKRVKLADLIDEKFVLLQPTSLIRRWLDGKFAELRKMPDVWIEAASLFLCCRYVAKGLGVTIADPFSIRSFANTDVVAKPIEGGNFQMSCAFVLRNEADPSPLAMEFMDIVQAEADRLVASW